MSSQAQIYGSGNPGLKVMGSESNRTLRDGRDGREGERITEFYCTVTFALISSVPPVGTPPVCRPGDLVHIVCMDSEPSRQTLCLP